MYTIFSLMKGFSLGWDRYVPDELKNDWKNIIGFC
jgi:hypothetical protein